LSRKQRVRNAGEATREKKSLYTDGGNINYYTKVSQKLKIQPSYDPVVAPLAYI
jgi:hypothetical protein